MDNSMQASQNFIFNSIKKGSRFFIIASIIFVFNYSKGYTQAVSVNPTQVASGLASSPLIGGNPNQAVFYFKLDKAGGGANTVTNITVPFTQDPSVRFSSAALYTSSNNIYDGLDVSVAPGIISATSISFIGAPLTDFGGGNGGASQNFFVVVTVSTSVTGATSTTTASLTGATDVVSSTGTPSGLVTGSPYSFVASSAAIGSLNSIATNGVAASPLFAGTTGKAVFGFSLLSNGAQTVSQINVQALNASGKLANYSLVVSTDANFSTGGDNSVVPTSAIVATATEIQITPTTAIDISANKNLFLVADIDNTVTTVTPALQATLDISNITVSAGGLTGGATGISYSFSSSQLSDIRLVGGTTSSIGYTTFQAASGLTSGGAPNSETLALFEIRDGGASLSDGDNLPTTLTDITFTLANFANVQTIAIFDEATNTNVGEQSVSSGIITFTGLTLAATDATHIKQFRIRATFNAVVTDNQQLDIAITSATASTAGSGFAAANAGGAFTTGTNAINVVADRLVFNPTSLATTNANTNFAPLSVSAVDAPPFGNVDKNRLNVVTLAKTSGTGTLTATPTASGNLTAGIRNWTSLSINTTGAKILTASYTGLTSATISISISSPGVIVTPGNATLCYNGSFQNLSQDIVITEFDVTDFAIGTDATFSLVLPTNFIFDTSVTTAPTVAGTGISNSAPGTLSYIGNSIVRFSYTTLASSLTSINSITITGLKVKYSGNVDTPPLPPLQILRLGGSAVQKGNSDMDARDHGTLSAVNSLTVVDFSVQELLGDPTVPPNQVNFSTSSKAVKLIGSPTGGTFSGIAVIFSAANGPTFDPTVAGVGNFDIFYTYTEGTGQSCVITIKKTFTVTANFVTGLLSSYCSTSSSSSISMLLTTVNSQFLIKYPLDPSGTYSFAEFVYWDPVTRLFTTIPSPNGTFNPSDPIYQRTTNTFGGVWLGYRAKFTATNVILPDDKDFVQDYYNINYVFVRIINAPTLSFNLPTSICVNASPLDLDLLVTPIPNSTTTDIFTGTAVTTPSANQWIFTPSSVPGATSSPQPVMITYNYRSSNGCTNSILKSIVVNPLPNNVFTVSPSSPVICQGGAIPTLTATTLGATYKWYTDNALTNLQQIGASYTPSTSDLDVNASGLTNFYVTQTVPATTGCEGPAQVVGITVNSAAISIAGPNSIICQGSNVDLTPIAIGASISGSATSATWTRISSGIPGTFTPNNVFGTASSYTPSASDIANGSVTFRLTTNDPVGPCSSNFDDVTIAITPGASANPIAPANICAPFIVTGQPNQPTIIDLSGSISNAVSGTWSIVSGGTGNLTSTGSLLAANLNNAYTSTISESLNGATIVFRLTTADPDGAGPCVPAFNNVTTIISKSVIVNAGSDFTVCSGSTIQLNGIIGGSASSASWSGGAGTFSPNNTSLNVQYNPTTTELNGGTVSLFLTTDVPNAICSSRSSTINVTINPKAKALPVAPPNVCAPDVIFGQPNQQTIINLGGSIANAGTASWSIVSGGTGTLPSISLPASGLTNIYTSTINESLNGATIVFRLTTADPDGAGPCQQEFTDIGTTINKSVIVSAGSDITVCAGQPIKLTSAIIGGSALTGTWTGGSGTFSPNNTTINADYIPTAIELANGATPTLTLITDDPASVCNGNLSTMKLTINPIPPAPLVTSTGIANTGSAPSPVYEYCSGSIFAPLNTTPSSNGTINWYSDLALTAQFGATPTINPSIVVNNVSTKAQDVYATETRLTCRSAGTPVKIVVHPLPVADFGATSYCLGDFMKFADASTISVPAPGYSAYSISNWNWNFGDLDQTNGSGSIAAGTNAGRTVGLYDQPQHKYAAISAYNISLTITSNKNCVSNPTQIVFSVGPVPQTDFKVDDVCNGDLTKLVALPGSAFDNSTTGRSITDNTWDFGDPASGTSNNYSNSSANATHTFSSTQTYSVSLIQTSGLGCIGTLTKQVYVLPSISFNNANSFEYKESFESGTGGWATENFIANSGGNTPSWNLLAPNGTVINSASKGTKAWVAGLQGANKTYFNSEKSALNGPCFDLTGLNKPVIYFDYQSDTWLKNDGAYMEYSTYNSTINTWSAWSILGKKGKGNNWYTHDFIIGLQSTNLPNSITTIGQSVGQEGWDDNSNGWTTSAYSLASYGSSTKFRIRYVFGSNPNPNPSGKFYEGFALDNISVQNSNRTVLAESFTNKIPASSTAVNNNFMNFKSAASSQSLVRIQYHTSFGGADDNNLLNPADPQARAAFYGVTSSFKGFIDGDDGSSLPPTSPSKFDGTIAPGVGTNSSNSENFFDNRALIPSPINISLTASATTTDVTVNAVIKTLTVPLPLGTGTSTRYLVQTAIVENVGGQYILRKLLPNAAGKPLTALTANSTQTVSYTWQSGTPINPANLSAICFVQDLTNKEVLQAVITSLPSTNLVTGVEPLNENDITIYPNPANQEFTVQLPKIASQKVAIKVIDQLGKEINTYSVGLGEREQTISTRDLAAAIYILQIETAQGVVRKKVMVAH
jgi:hypothetical protein